jgi:hypothetical protein
VPVVTAAVVPTVTVTDCDPLPVICTEEVDKPQVGAGVTDVLKLQLRVTAPTKDPDGAIVRLNVASCPALMACEVGDPDAAPIVKSDAVVPTPDKAIASGLIRVLSVTVMRPDS